MYQNIPQELKDLKQWVTWKLIDKRKLLINPKTGKAAKSTDPQTWTSFSNAVKKSSSYNGIGFVFTKDDPYCGIDIDNNTDTKLMMWLDSYAEYSQSGKGIHIIVKAKLPETGRKNNNFEIYDKGRYFIMTGNVLHNKPIMASQGNIDKFMSTEFPEKLPKPAKIPTYSNDIIKKIQNSAQADKFNPLWNGDHSAYNSQSEADLALLSMLHFWTGGNQAESFALFAQSGLMRKKWTREDYRLDSWNKIDHGDVLGQVSIPTVSELKPLVTPTQMPWRKITSDDVREAIKGSCLETLIEVYESPMDPPLPLEISFLKALVTAGANMCYRREENTVVDAAQRGAALANLQLMTAGSQVCNIYGLIVGESGIGKDVGGLFNQIMLDEHLYVGNAGSAEGLADTFRQPDMGNGVISISEFQNWIKEGTWQHKANPFITSSFSDGWFKVQFSRKNKNDDSLRESHYCFPSILANVQPAVIEKIAQKVDVHSGFLSRFIITTPPSIKNRPDPDRNLVTEFNKAKNILKHFVQKEGTVLFKKGYMQRTFDMFYENNAYPAPHWKRLVNEYGPRIAAILSVRPDTSSEIDLSVDHMDKAEIIVQWLFKMGESVFADITDDSRASRDYKIMKLVYQYIKNNEGTTRRLVHQNVKIDRETMKVKERDQAITELVELGCLVTHEKLLKISHTMEDLEAKV